VPSTLHPAVAPAAAPRRNTLRDSLENEEKNLVFASDTEVERQVAKTPSQEEKTKLALDPTAFLSLASSPWRLGDLAFIPQHRATVAR